MNLFSFEDPKTNACALPAAFAAAAFLNFAGIGLEIGRAHV